MGQWLLQDLWGLTDPEFLAVLRDLLLQLDQQGQQIHLAQWVQWVQPNQQGHHLLGRLYLLEHQQDQ